VRTVNVAELKNKLSAYLTFAKAGEVIVIRERNLPVAKLIPFVSQDATEEELVLVASGVMRLAEQPWDPDKLDAMPMAKLKGKGRTVTQALLDERNEGR
jgi:prevent-host-death family protein